MRQHHDFMAEASRKREIVQRDNNGAALGREATEHFEKAESVSGIDAGRWLIGKNNGRFLREGPGKEDAREFPTREFRYGTRGEMLDVHQTQRLADGTTALATGP